MGKTEELCVAYQQGNESAMIELLHNNEGRLIKWCEKWAEIYEITGYDFEDLMQEATIGIINAAKSWSCEKSEYFLPYAGRAVHRAVMMEMGKSGFRFKVSANFSKLILLVEKYRKVYNEDDWLEIFLKDYPQYSEHMKNKIDACLAFLGTHQGILDISDLESIIDEDSPTVETEFFDRELKESVATVTGTLSQEHRQIINLYYGLPDGVRSYSDQEIAEMIGSNKSRVRNARLKAEMALRHPLRRKKLAWYW